MRPRSASQEREAEGDWGRHNKVKVMREVVIVALAGLLIEIIVAAVLVHFLS